MVCLLQDAVDGVRLLWNLFVTCVWWGMYKHCVDLESLFTHKLAASSLVKTAQQPVRQANCTMTTPLSKFDINEGRAQEFSRAQVVSL